MELRIISPQESGFVKEIQWNHEELKAEIAKKMQEYKTLVFTEDTIKDAKKDRADLNKLKSAFEDERKRIKKLCMEPYNRFESQVKEITSLIEEPIRLIDSQIKEVEFKKREQKRKEIESVFNTIGFQLFVTLDKIWDEKWLNATVSLSKVEEQMKSHMYQIGEDIATIQRLPEFSFEAMEAYKKTLNLTMAIQEGQRLSDIQKKKEAFEEEQRIKAEEAKKESQVAEHQKEELPQEPIQNVDIPKKGPIMCLDFRVWGTREQLMELRNYMKENGLKFGKVE